MYNRTCMLEAYFHRVPPVAVPRVFARTRERWWSDMSKFLSCKVYVSLWDVKDASRVCTLYSSVYTRWPFVFGWKKKGRFSKPSTHPPSPVQAISATTMTTPVTYVKQKKKKTEKKCPLEKTARSHPAMQYNKPWCL